MVRSDLMRTVLDKEKKGEILEKYLKVVNNISDETITVNDDEDFRAMRLQEGTYPIEKHGINFGNGYVTMLIRGEDFFFINGDKYIFSPEEFPRAEEYIDVIYDWVMVRNECSIERLIEQSYFNKKAQDLFSQYGKKIHEAIKFLKAVK